jgi:hypothetical protein
MRGGCRRQQHEPLRRSPRRVHFHGVHLRRVRACPRPAKQAALRPAVSSFHPPSIPSLEEAAAASARRAAGLLSFLLASACVWVDGNPEIAAPRIEDCGFSSPPPLAIPIAWSTDTAPEAKEEVRKAALREAVRLVRTRSPLLVEAEGGHVRVCRGTIATARSSTSATSSTCSLFARPPGPSRGASKGRS